jgi:hypothetical protein
MKFFQINNFGFVTLATSSVKLDVKVTRLRRALAAVQLLAESSFGGLNVA